MKKIVLVLSIISILFLVGCNINQDINNDVEENAGNQNQESVVNSGENISGQIGTEGSESVEDEHVNPYMQYSPLHTYYTNGRFMEVIIAEDDYAVEELNSHSIAELQILRNLPFAKKGHDFKNSDLAEFFDNEPWYERIEEKEVTMSELSSDEQKALAIIDAQISKHKQKLEGVPKYEYDSSKPIVYPFYSFETEMGRYDFPYINIDSANIKKINNDIYNWAMPIILETYSTCEYAKYEYYLNDDILTVIIEEDDDWGGDSGFYLNIDVNTGDLISNTEFLQKNGIEIEKVTNLKEKLLNSKTTSVYSTMFLKEYYSKVERVYKEDAKEIIEFYRGYEQLNNIEECALVYLDKENKFHVILELPTLAGQYAAACHVDCIVEF